MIQKGKIGFKGRYRFKNYITLPTGRTILLSVSGWMENMIVSLGEANILNRLKGNTEGPIIGMGVGTSGTAPAKGNTSLTSEVRKAIETATVNTTAKTVTFKTTFTAAEINSKQEIGLFTHATAGQGQMICRSVFSSISIPTGSNMSVEYVLTLTA